MTMAVTYLKNHKKLLVAVGLLLLAAVFVVPRTIANNAAVGTLPSSVGPGDDNPGTPVGPPKKVILCHDGHTIYVDNTLYQLI